MSTVLDRIVARRRQRLDMEDDDWAPPSAADGPLLTPETNPFLAALAARRGQAVIAEVKMGSPSLGSLAGRFDPELQAERYARAGAAALSVVVEPDFFGGSWELLQRCRRSSGLPAVAKDFVVSPRQLAAARLCGADAVLLVAALYDAPLLRDWAVLAREHDLVPLVELHGGDDLAKLEGGEWELVGVNNRDLRSFEVSLDHSFGLAPRLPRGAIKVSESGIGSGAERRSLAAAGYDAFLVGGSLLLAVDPEERLRELLAEATEAER